MIVTFYSYREGTERSTALATIGTLLAMHGRRVLLVDFDLRTAALAEYFQDRTPDLDQRTGVIEMLSTVSYGVGHFNPRWQDHVSPIPPLGPNLSIMTAGRQDQDYPGKASNFDWDWFFDVADGGSFIEKMRQEWRDEYDFVLVDGGEGISDASAVATVSLPDLIAVLVPPDRPGAEKLVDVLRRVQDERQKLAFDRLAVAVLPLPTTVDQADAEEATAWSDFVAGQFAEFYDDWLPADLPVSQVIERTSLPPTATAPSGNHLPDPINGSWDPTSLTYVLETVAVLIETELGPVQRIVRSRSAPVVPTARETPPVQHVQEPPSPATTRPAASETRPAEPDVPPDWRDTSTAFVPWHRSLVWSATADKLERSIGAFRIAGYILLVVSAALAMLAGVAGLPSAAARACAIGSAVCLGLILVRRLKWRKAAVDHWMKARWTSDALSSEVYLFLAGAGGYSGPGSESRLQGAMHRIEDGVSGLRIYTADVEPARHPLPNIVNSETYFSERVFHQVRQLDFRARVLEARISRFHVAQILLVLAGVALGAYAAAFQALELAGWIAVSTTAIGGLATHVAAGRYDLRYVGTSRTARELERLRWTASTTTSSTDLAELVIRAESVILAQNDGRALENLAGARPIG